MELIGLKVKHTVFGVGTITEKGGNYITVEFAAKTTKFVYPDAFEKFIKAAVRFFSARNQRSHAAESGL